MLYLLKRNAYIIYTVKCLAISKNTPEEIWSTTLVDSGMFGFISELEVRDDFIVVDNFCYSFK